MKKILLLSLTLIFTQVITSQVTDTGGNVGIGTTNPQKKLHINALGDDGIALETNNALLGKTGSGTFTQLLFWNGTNAYYGRSATGAGVNNHYFRTGGADRMIINSAGRVGIGTISPLERFQIGNAFSFHDGGHKILFFGYASGNNDLDPSTYAASLRFDAVNGKLFFGTSNTITSDPVARLTLDNAGNAGIGTTSPKTKLHVTNGSTGSNPHGFSDLVIEDDDHTMLSLLTPNNKTAYYGFSDSEDDYVGGIQYEHLYDRMIFRVNNYGNNMTIINNGNVGIGTTTPDSKLAVNGRIHTKEVKVDLIGWPDYVFENDYNLPTLEEVEQHIQENGHLQNIPSAEEVKENGILLGEMNAKLLQKIEELTLYTIQQEKKIKDQENMIENIEKENEILKELSIKFIELQSRLEKLETK